MPTSGSAAVPLAGGTYALQNGTSTHVGFYNVTTSACQGSPGRLSSASGNLPSFTPERGRCLGAAKTQVILSWSAASGATGYRCRARVSYAEDWGSLANMVMNGTSFTVMRLAAGDTLTAIDANGRGPSVKTIVSTTSS